MNVTAQPDREAQTGTHMRITDLTEFGQILRKRREALGLTQAAAAARSGVSTRLWSEVEGGKRPNISLTTATRMLHTLGVDLYLAVRGQGSQGQ